MTEQKTVTEPRSAFGEVLTEIMAAKGRRTDDDAIIQLGEEAGLNPRDDAPGFTIAALLDLARDECAERPGSIPQEIVRTLWLTRDEKDLLGVPYAFGRRGLEEHWRRTLEALITRSDALGNAIAVRVRHDKPEREGYAAEMAVLEEMRREADEAIERHQARGRSPGGAS